MEVEYHVMPSTCSEVIWIIHLLREIGVNAPTLIPLHADNTSVIQTAPNLTY